jgi:hypothetical protein
VDDKSDTTQFSSEFPGLSCWETHHLDISVSAPEPVESSELSDSSISIFDSCSENLSPNDEICGYDYEVASCLEIGDPKSENITSEAAPIHLNSQVSFPESIRIVQHFESCDLNNKSCFYACKRSALPSTDKPVGEGHARSYRRQTSELIGILDKLLDSRPAVSQPKSKRKAPLKPKPRARNVVLRQAADLIRRLKLDEQVCTPRQIQPHPANLFCSLLLLYSHSRLCLHFTP